MDFIVNNFSSFFIWTIFLIGVFYPFKIAFSKKKYTTPGKCSCGKTLRLSDDPTAYSKCCTGLSISLCECGKYNKV